MTYNAPGKSHRCGMTLIEIMDRFPTERTAIKWFESALWPDQRKCGHCKGTKTRKASHKSMPYWCTDCRKYFSVRTGTVLACSNVKLRKWAIAIYLELTSLKSISSMKLHRDIGVTQGTAWFMLQRIREAWIQDTFSDFAGPVEVDETYLGGRKRNLRKSKRDRGGPRGPDGKRPVIGAKDRASNAVSAKVIENPDKQTLQRFVAEKTLSGATVYTDDAAAYKGIPYRHETVTHSAGEYVRGMAHTNGIESFWAMLKRAHKGTFHKISPKHLHRYINEFAGKHNVRELDTMAQMQEIARRMAGRRLTYRALIADNGLPSGAYG